MRNKLNMRRVKQLFMSYKINLDNKSQLFSNYKNRLIIMIIMIRSSAYNKANKSKLNSQNNKQQILNNKINNKKNKNKYNYL